MFCSSFTKYDRYCESPCCQLLSCLLAVRYPEPLVCLQAPSARQAQQASWNVAALWLLLLLLLALLLLLLLLQLLLRLMHC